MSESDGAGVMPPLHFVTTTAVSHACLFRRDLVKRILVDQLFWLQGTPGLSLFAFVIMPNHLHLLLHCPAAASLPDLIQDYKANCGRLIVRQFQAERRQLTLQFLARATGNGRPRHAVWEEGYRASLVPTAELFRQRVAYIHHNPLQPRWQLAPRPESYLWSSARFHLLGEPALIPLSRPAGW